MTQTGNSLPLPEKGAWKSIDYFYHLSFFLFFGYFMALYFPIVWNENDDFIMKKISEGFFSPSESQHLIFINIVFGWLIKLLYSLKPGTEWYSWSFVCLYSIGNATISFLIFRRSYSIWNLTALLFIFYFIILKNNFEFQFTILSSYLGICGYLLLLEQKKDSVNLNFYKIISFSIIIISSLIRLESFFLVSLFFVPLFFFYYNLKDFLKDKIYFISSIIIIIAFQISNYISYSQNNWNFYKEYNSSRHTIIDSPSENLSLIEKEINKQGWKIFDLELFKSQYFETSETFNIQKIKIISIIYKEKYFSWPSFFFINENIFEFSCILTIFIILFLIKKNKVNYLILFSFVLSTIALLYFSISRNIYERVTTPVFLSTWLSLYFFNSINQTKYFSKFQDFSKRIKWITPFLCLTFIYLISDKIINKFHYYSGKIKVQENFIKEIKTDLRSFTGQNAKLGVIMGPAPSWFFARLPVFEKKSPVDLEFIKPIFSGWLSNSPLKKVYMTQFGNPEMPDYKLSINNPNIIFLYETNNNILKKYLNHHYSDVRIDTFYVHPSKKYCAFRLKK
jgi:hypothetical protein